MSCGGFSRYRLKTSSVSFSSLWWLFVLRLLSTGCFHPSSSRQWYRLAIGSIGFFTLLTAFFFLFLERCSALLTSFCNPYFVRILPVTICDITCLCFFFSFWLLQRHPWCWPWGHGGQTMISALRQKQGHFVAVALFLMPGILRLFLSVFWVFLFVEQTF